MLEPFPGAGDIGRELYGKIWHTTHPDRYQSILDSGAILVNPPIKNEERWRTGGGPETYPYVRKINGISLFDFGEFDAESYEKLYPSSSWAYFVPCHLVWTKAVWLEIDTTALGDRYLTPSELLERWRRGSFSNNIMPGIEGAALGDIESSMIVRALLCSNRNGEFKEI